MWSLNTCTIFFFFCQFHFHIISAIHFIPYCRGQLVLKNHNFSLEQMVLFMFVQSKVLFCGVPSSFLNLVCASVDIYCMFCFVVDCLKNRLDSKELEYFESRDIQIYRLLHFVYGFNRILQDHIYISICIYIQGNSLEKAIWNRSCLILFA